MPSEDEFVVQPFWRKYIHPRHGRVHKRIRPDRYAPNFCAHEFEELTPKVEAILGHPSTEPSLAKAGKDFLADAPTPLGAAAVIVALHHGNVMIRNARYGEFADWLCIQYGVRFMAETAAALGRMSVSFGDDVSPHLVTPGWFIEIPVIERARELLASASDEDYAAVVESLASCHGDDFWSRLAVCYLVPTHTGWVDELLDLVAVLGEHRFFADDLLCRSIGTLSQFDRLAAGLGHRWTARHKVDALYSLVDALGVAVVPKLVELVKELGPQEDEHRRILKILAALPTDEAFDAVIERLDGKNAKAVALDAIARYPVRALRRLAVTGPEELFRDHVLASPDLIESVRADLPPEVVAAIDGVTGGQDRVRAAESLPDLLVRPPWTRPRPEPVVIEGLQPPAAEVTLVWADGEQEAWSTPFKPYWSDGSFTVDAALTAYRTESLDLYWKMSLVMDGPEDVGRAILAEWEPPTFGMVEWGRFVAARYGLDAFRVIEHLVGKDREFRTAPLVLPFAAPRFAMMMARWLMQTGRGGFPKPDHAVAIAWLLRHCTLAARELIPVALGAEERDREAAVAALRTMAPARFEQILAAADEYGPAVRQAIEDTIGADLLGSLPAKIPAIPAWADPGVLPQILLKDKSAALPADVVRTVLTMLALSTADVAYGGVRIVKEVCDPESLATLAWTLYERWEGAGRPSKEGWAFAALGWFGDDRIARRITPLIRDWPGSGGHARAVTGLKVLAAIGTDVALLNLHTLAQKAQFKGLKQRAQEKIAQVAKQLGLSADQLADRLVPTFGLDEAATLTIDYGPRKYVVGFDEQLKPYVVDPDGKRRKDLPKPAAKDDQELAPAEHKRFAALKKDVRTVASTVIGRLEAAMVAQREWSADEFTTLLVGHPLVWHIVRRLVWRTGKGEAFRVAEDRTFADASDDPWILPEDASVTVAHPLLLQDTVDTWAEMFADYEIVQPFPQLGRPVHTLTDEESAAERLTRFEGVTVPVGRVLGLVSRGWQRGTPQDAGVECWILRPVPNGCVMVDLDPGIPVGNVDVFPEQTLRRVRFLDSVHSAWSGKDAKPFGRLDPVTACELLAELTAVTS